MDTDGAAAEFDTIEYEVVMLTAHLLRIAIEERNIFNDWSREWVMRGNVATLLLIEEHERELGHPEEFIVGRTDR